MFILNSLKERIPDREKLVKYLNSSLKMNPHSVYFVLNTLSLLEEDIPDLSDFAVERLNRAMCRVEKTFKRDIHELEAGITATYSFEMPNVLREVYSLVNVLRLLNVRCEELKKAKNFVRMFQIKEGRTTGFGVKIPNLEDTYYCVYVLAERDESVIRFIMDREWKDGGFSKVPGSYPPYIEDTFFAVESLHLMGEKYGNSRTARYISNLQNADGGFRRSVYLGTSSLEFSYYAVASLLRIL